MRNIESGPLRNTAGKIRTLEQSPKTYEKMGVHIYREYFMMGGNFWRRNLWKHIGVKPLDLDNLEEGIPNLVRKRNASYVMEGVGLVFGILSASKLQVSLADGDVARSIMYTTLVAMRPYSTFFQHYHRAIIKRRTDQIKDSPEPTIS